MTTDPPTRPPLLRGVRGAVYVLLGLFFVGLGVLGALLPVLPTTPFLLLASFFFVRSSPRLNDWLLRSPWFGPLLRDWHQHRAVTLRVKVTAVLVLLTTIAASLWFGNLSWPLVLLLLGLAGVGLVVILRLNVIRRPDRDPERDCPPEAPPVAVCRSTGEPNASPHTTVS